VRCKKEQVEPGHCTKAAELELSKLELVGLSKLELVRRRLAQVLVVHSLGRPVQEEPSS